jgi:hypothetical protein
MQHHRIFRIIGLVRFAIVPSYVLAIESNEWVRSRKAVKSNAIIAALMATAAFATLLASPALSAAASLQGRTMNVAAMAGQFTPATGDPRLIERYAKVSDATKRNFRFTPVVARSADGSRAITVVVRAPARTLGTTTAQTLLPTEREKPLAIAPVAYNLGKSVGYTKFTIPDAGPGIDLATLPKARAPETATRKSRFTTELKLGQDSAAETGARTLNPDDAASVDVGAGYNLSRRLKVTAGVRYKQAYDRLTPLADDSRDSQAVYVGTRFKF